jgi:competence protein ComFC
VLAIRSAFRFEGTIKAAIHELKYHNVRSIAPLLAEYVTPLAQHIHFHPEVVLPVPMHRKRLRERGYNQAALLAESVADALGLPVPTGVLTRIKGGPSQVISGSWEARWRSAEGAHLCTNGTVSDKRVLLVDDVCTTGATIEACGKALRAAGATEVVAVTVAREV